jgi:hypothetical protein
MMKLYSVIAATIACIHIVSCSSLPPAQRLLEPQEIELETDGSTAMLFHSALYYPSAIGLKFPGFIVGIEKSPVEMISQEGDIKIQAIPGSGFSKEELFNEVVDSKILFVSHIIETDGQHYGLSNCALYNAYYRKHQQQPLSPINYCDNVNPLEVSPQNAYLSSWKGMDILKQKIDEQIDQYTHVVVITMGWNTVQEEAVRNFNSMMKNLKHAAGDAPFNPLFIGVTWPSQWAAKWLEPIVRAVSFPWKAHDADEVGLTWLGVLLHKTLADVSKPIVVIGHSFGARATSVAACIGPAITEHETEGKRQNKTIDYLINFQGAYRANRLIGKPKDGKLQYPDSCKNNVKNIILTSSISDTAMNALFWGNDKYAGDDESYDQQCNDNQNGVRCGRASKQGNLTIINHSSSHITYINADDLINKKSYLSGGNAHSDIYRSEHGVLLWNLLSRQDINQFQ